MSNSATCMRCKTQLDPVSYHCKCGDMAEFHCPTCGFFRTVSVSAPPACHSCQQPMVERGYRPGEPPIDDFVCELDLPDGVDEEKEAAYRGWQKFLAESPEERMPLTFRQERRLQVYDRLIWKIDHDRNPVEKELIYR